MMRKVMRQVGAITAALFMLATAVVLSWMVMTSGVLSPTEAQAAPIAPPVAAAATDQADVAAPTAIVTGGFQVSQPRDPFRPLITESSPVVTQPGGGGETFTPAGTVISLQQIRDTAGVLRATVVVNGVSYDVGVGETFAGSYKVISLSDTKGVFMFGDNAFELSVGQEILK